ncbi:hypothetical protein [Lacticaseibacillus paracasei]|uniref:hypothetical protein n=1 Tax=Lacticaseibacillus paracasei TaxID=1597 RepID=UPI001066471C|nr:hypothetical protein [Lacticaseibacillus paracasei]TEA85915.1 hypothetical protein TE33_12635 [Lacticaseibacillus paracasei]
MRKYGSDQLEDKRAYYAQQRIKPTGKFTEMIVRSYYIIWALAHTNPDKECFTSQSNEHKIKDLVYQDLGDPVASVVADARNELVKMYYVRYVKDDEDNRWKIRLEKPLDFLQPGEDLAYRTKYEKAVKHLR